MESEKGGRNGGDSVGEGKDGWGRGEGKEGWGRGEGKERRKWNFT